MAEMRLQMRFNAKVVQLVRTQNANLFTVTKNSRRESCRSALTKVEKTLLTIIHGKEWDIIYNIKVINFDLQVPLFLSLPCNVKTFKKKINKRREFKWQKSAKVGGTDIESSRRSSPVAGF